MWNTPPDCSTKPATIDNPSPVPLPAALVVKNGSVTRSMSSGGMPEPSSLTRMRRYSRERSAEEGRSPPSARSIATRTVPPSGIASRALIRRLTSANSNCA